MFDWVLVSMHWIAFLLSSKSPFNTRCPLKGHTYLSKPAAFICKFVWVYMSFLWTPGDKGLTLVSIYLTFYFCYLQRRWIINHILDKRQKISSLNWRQAKAIICSANEPDSYNNLWNYYLTINFLKGLLHITIFSKKYRTIYYN